MSALNFLRHKPHRELSSASDLAIRINDSDSQPPVQQTRWGMILVVFMRLMAALWLFQGLVEWANVLLPKNAVFDSLDGAAAAVIIFFAIADLVAAVGLWLATPWGGALWLFAATSQIFAAMTVRGAFSAGWIVVDVLLIVIYFALTFKAAMERD
jgi:hypothetical protein